MVPSLVTGAGSTTRCVASTATRPAAVSSPSYPCRSACPRCLSVSCPIFTPAMNCAGSWIPPPFFQYPRKLQAHTLRAILLLLYGAGLRVSESVALTLEDIDLPSAVITIRDTKFNKTRLVPLGLELNRVMAQYAASRTKAGHAQTGSAPFFVLRRGGPISVQLVEQRFKYLSEHAGISRTDGARYQPRLHDLRQHAESWIMPSLAE